MNTLTDGPSSVNSPISRIRPGKRNSLRQLLALKDVVVAAAVKEGIPNSELIGLAHAWVALEEKRVTIRGGGIKPEGPRKPKRPIGLGIVEHVEPEIPETVGPRPA